jgi:hypothetical protein
MNSVKLIAVLFGAVLMVACTTGGTNFVKPADGHLVLGTTTKNQIIALMGKPYRTKQMESNGERLEMIGYAYTTQDEEGTPEGSTPARTLDLIFHNNILVGKESSSTFKSDNTCFNFEQADAIKEGVTASDVVSLLGTPSGEYRYPVIANPDMRALVYEIAYGKGAWFKHYKLVVELNKNNIVQKSNFTCETVHFDLAIRKVTSCDSNIWMPVNLGSCMQELTQDKNK